MDRHAAAVESAYAAAVTACESPTPTCRSALNAVEVQARGLNEVLAGAVPDCLKSATGEVAQAGHDYLEGSILALDDFDVAKPGWTNGLLMLSQAHVELDEGRLALRQSVCV